MNPLRAQLHEKLREHVHWTRGCVCGSCIDDLLDTVLTETLTMIRERAQSPLLIAEIEKLLERKKE